MTVEHGAATTVDHDLAELLNHHPHCEDTRRHTTHQQPEADYFYDQHGCLGKFLCAPCIEHRRRWMKHHLRSGGPRKLGCTVCQRSFTELTSLFQVVPL